MSRSEVARFARVSCDETTARRLADGLAETLDATSVAAFEDGAGGWSVELHVAGPIDEAHIRAVVRAAAGETVARALRFGAIAERDWVAASLAGLSPCRGRTFPDPWRA